MTRVLRDKTTKQFVKADGLLTSALTEALPIDSAAHALRVLEQHNLKNVELVLKVGSDSAYDVVLPIN